MTSPAAAGPLVTATGLSKTHRTGSGHVQALHDVSFDLEPGSFYVLTGPSGSGKSTLLTVLAGWDTADAGTLTWSADISHPGSWQSVAIVPQSLGLLAELTIGENVELPARLGGDREPRPTGLLERLGVGHLTGRYPAQASLGEQQRAAVARALLTRPRLVLLDEPTAHQDSDTSLAVIALLREAVDQKGCVLAATHSPAVQAAADRTLQLLDGHLTEQAPDHPPARDPHSQPRRVM